MNGAVWIIHARTPARIRTHKSVIKDINPSFVYYEKEVWGDEYTLPPHL
jgi:hypothetical protein